MRHRLSFLAVTFSLAFCVHVAGCGPSLVQIPTKKGLAYVDKKKRKKEPLSSPTPGTSIALAVKPIDYLGCPVLPMQVTEEENTILQGKGLVMAYSSGCDLHEISGSDPKDLIIAETKGSGAASAVLAKDVADTTVTLLEKRLSRKFGSVTVTKGTAPQSGVYSVTPGMRYVTIRNYFLVTVKLEALAPGQAPVVVEGKSLVRMSTGHLGWAIVMMILHFPIGLAIAPSLLGSVRIGYFRTAVIDAMDEAAEALAVRLAGGPAPPAVPPPASPPPAVTASPPAAAAAVSAPPAAAAAVSAPPAVAKENTLKVCMDGMDNDGDGAADCDDQDCMYFKVCADAIKAVETTPENTPVACQDGKDNDGDSHVDCSDQDCMSLKVCKKPSAPASPQVSPENTLQACQDGKDNNGNGLVDCQDKDCKFFKACAAKTDGALSSEDLKKELKSMLKKQKSSVMKCLEKHAADTSKVKVSVELNALGEITDVSFKTDIPQMAKNCISKNIKKIIFPKTGQVIEIAHTFQ